MQHFLTTSTLCLVFTLISGCASLHPNHHLLGKSGEACPGKIQAPADGLTEINDEALLQNAEDVHGYGKLSAGKVFAVQKPLTVYRVWDSSRPYSVTGQWWSFDAPKGSRDSYRAAEDICQEWSALDRVSTCTLKVGAHIVVGPGQSVGCQNGLYYPPSPVNQVYVPNDGKNNQLFVDCPNPGVAWPQ